MKYRVSLSLKKDRLNNKDINLYFALFVSGISFFLFPLLGCVLSILITFYCNKKSFLLITFGFLYVYIILIQGQRVVDPNAGSDWNHIIPFYEEAHSLKIFNTFDGFKDLGYTFWIYLGHKIFGPRVVAFLDFTVDLEMLLFGLSSIRIWKKSGTDARHGLCSIVLVFLFSELLLVTNNLLRQQFATSIVLYGLILKYTEYSKNKNWIFFMIWGFLTHSMTLFLIPLFFLPINRKPSIKNLLFGMAFFFSLSIIFILVKNYLISSSIYILQRIGNGEITHDDSIINPKVIIPFFFIVILIYGKHYVIDKKVNKSIWIGNNIILYVASMCILTMPLPMFVTRIYIFRAAILNIFIPYVFSKKSLISNIYLGGIIIIFVYRFAFSVQSAWLNIVNNSTKSFFALFLHMLS